MEDFSPKVKGKKSKEKASKVEFTHLEKIYWPKEKFTKGDLIDYYAQISPFILPYLKDRPIVLHRYPNGIEGKEFYQKDLSMSHPSWIKTYSVEHSEGVKQYLAINDTESLLYAINLGSIDFHPFLAPYAHLERPDYCVIDLDPHEISFDKVIETARVIHVLLEKIKVAHYCKSSGGNGLHLLIPLHGKYNFEQSRQFAEIIGLSTHQQLPETTSLERDPKKRPRNIYIDCLQNRIAQTLVSPYAVRPRPKALVSTPLLWEEVNADLEVSAFSMTTVPNRLKKRGDILKPVLGPGVDLKAAIRLLA